MAGTLRTKTIGSIAPGLNNRRPDFKLEHITDGKKDTFVRAAVNTDITTEGTAKRRRGFASVIAGSGCHSAWSPRDGSVMYFVDNGALKRAQGGANAPVITDLSVAVHGPVSYTETDVGLVAYTDGTVLRYLNAAGDRPLGVEPLAATPTLTVGTGGAMPAGRYQMVATLVNAAGEESVASPLQQVVVGAGGTLLVGGLPTSWPSGVTQLRIYLTTPNGATPFKARTLITPVTSVLFPSMPLLEGRCATLLLAPMPAGQIVRMCNGRLLIASGSMLVYSEPYALALRNPARNFIPFPQQITMMESCPLGFFIAADHTYWLFGDLASASLAPVLPYGAVPRTGAAIANSSDVMWMSERGRVRGMENGTAKVLEEPNVIVPVAQSGASLFRESDGMKQALTSLFGLKTDRMAAGSYMTAEVIRKGTTL
jgi:hypothetical protein